MKLETDRLMITEFDLSMAQCVHENSLDTDTRNYLPDEVFETVEDARQTLSALIRAYQSDRGPFVYPVLLKNGTNIGYVQLAPLAEGYEVGYHIAAPYTHRGYATEALQVFLAHMMTAKHIDKVYGICVLENHASKRVLEKCGFCKEFEGFGTYQGTQQEIVRYALELKNPEL